MGANAPIFVPNRACSSIGLPRDFKKSRGLAAKAAPTRASPKIFFSAGKQNISKKATVPSPKPIYLSTLARSTIKSPHFTE